jgi:hypothetical protein
MFILFDGQMKHGIFSSLVDVNISRYLLIGIFGRLQALDILEVNPVREAERIVEDWASSHRNVRSLLEEKKYELWNRHFEVILCLYYELSELFRFINEVPRARDVPRTILTSYTATPSAGLAKLSGLL